ncbi:MAG: hypothetical protein L6R40_007070 [Gallowayella cf. fulva]|nr:MAG: hypothetical protein L6R40_007070 [Xanthomendoza cf. fulva]
MASLIHSIIRYQPFKALWVLAVALLTILRLPFWFFYLLPSFLRQHPSWTLRQSFMIRLFKVFCQHTSLVRAHPHWSITPNSEKQRWERIPPSQKDIYRGVLDDREIKPVEVGGTWYPTAHSPADTKRKGVILHFHGGAFVVGDGRKSDLDHGAGLLTAHTDCWVLGLQYRIASNPGCRFPAALQDAVTAYQCLLDRGIPASSIVVSGDSAGANLAIALLRYITEHPGLLPKPKAALLWCAWVNPAACMSPYPCSGNRNYKTDFVEDAFVEWGVRAYAPAPLDATGPYISPMNHPFQCAGVPLWLQFGELEILADDIVKFAEGMRRVEGNEVDVHEDKGAPHDIFLLGATLGFGQATREMAEAMGKWLKGKL